MTPGPVALVSGAAGGMGGAIVAGLVEDGFHVVGVDACAPMPGAASRPGREQALRDLESRSPGRVDTAIIDVRHGAAVGRLIESIDSAHQRLDVVVAAAGAVAGGHAMWEAPEGELDVMLDVNLRGVWNLAAAAVPLMLRAEPPRSGRFIAIASAAGHRGLQQLTAYGASKHAVVGLVSGLAADLRGSGITATVVSPGSTRTEMLAATAALYGLDSVEPLAERHLVERVLEPDEIADAVRWLSSPRSGAVTGAVLHVDGGFTT
ncbi:SDR family mycofactocin-dependent oxidoreductase [Nocardioides albertanoniae]|uniref:SDR family mycofactocin-dependent oxidoreductase n=1 Tax=Nocardioides albertanoniae TaxID=1175486 RepID=A0A543A4V5_9ACTN|nr:mycofactocin-coupled SDR family oxidoreductase [Nocardioides albertanoniae]TQL67568.1 SDR family mycofactocin-dependent oxidoreductase [Nocardioides albertanoniae]